MKNPAEDLLGGGGSGGNCGDGGESAIDSIEECLPPSDDNGLQQTQLSSGGGSVCCGQLERLDCDRSREPMAMAPSSVGIIRRVIGVKSNIDCCCLLLSR